MQVTIKSSQQQFSPENRRAVVVRLMDLLSASFPGLRPERVTTLFEEVPVEQIAIGSSIIVFGSPRGVLTADPSLMPAP